MKFDRRSPRAWIVFGLTALSLGAAMAVGIPLRRVARGPSRPRVVLYGHTFAGNLRAFADHAPPGARDRWEVGFLYLDPRRYRRHDVEGVRRLLALNPLHLLWVVRADAVVTSHGPGVFRPLVGGVSGLRFVDVWHGVGYHRRDAYLETNRGYDLFLLPSPWAGDFLVDRGLDRGRVAATGHGLWDSVMAQVPEDELCRRQDLPVRSATRVLVAPTWTNAGLGEQSPLFGTSWEEVLDRLDAWAAENDVDIIFRSHLNAGEGTSRSRPRVFNRPFTRYPATVDALQLADVLVTDWSSIGVDFLPLARPIVYLDIPPPFEVGHLSAGDRPGAIVGSVEDLLDELAAAVTDPAAFVARHRTRIDQVEVKACGGLADGLVVARYWEALDELAGR